MHIGPYSFEAFKQKAADFHGYPAPGILLGGYMVEMAKRRLPEGTLFEALVESRKCLPDAVQLLTLCSTGNGWMKVLDLGRYALSLYDKYTGEGVRVYVDPEKMRAYPELEAWFMKRKPKKDQDSDLLLREIEAAGENVCSLVPVRMHAHLLVHGHSGGVSLCPECGESFPSSDGPVCRGCQGEAPFTVMRPDERPDKGNDAAAPAAEPAGKTALRAAPEAAPDAAPDAARGAAVAAVRSSHVDKDGNAVMVDDSDKTPAARTAVAEGRIRVSPVVLEAVRRGTAAKGDVLGVAQLAGIMGAKRTSELVPLCHPLPLSHCSVVFTLEHDAIRAECAVKTVDRTGVEMEALTGVSLALLTVYDMCKSMGKEMDITGIRLLRKTGGKSGDYAYHGRATNNG